MKSRKRIDRDRPLDEAREKGKKVSAEAQIFKGTIMAKAKKKSVRKRRDMVSPFRNRIWDLFAKEATGMDGADVELALRQAGEEIWAVGIDDIYSGMPNQSDEALGNAFDITWLTIVASSLRRSRTDTDRK